MLYSETGMRKYLLHFLMLLMITPGLACGGILCAGKAQAAAPSAIQDMPCHEHMEQKPDNNKSVMLFKDCSGTYLYKSGDLAGLEKSASVEKIFYGPLAALIPDSIFLVTAHTIRGPPPDQPDLSRIKPSILLTTLRFRE